MFVIIHSVFFRRNHWRGRRLCETEGGHLVETRKSGGMYKNDRLENLAIEGSGTNGVREWMSNDGGHVFPFYFLFSFFSLVHGCLNVRHEFLFSSYH